MDTEAQGRQEPLQVQILLTGFRQGQCKVWVPGTQKKIPCQETVRQELFSGRVAEPSLAPVSDLGPEGVGGLGEPLERLVRVAHGVAGHVRVHVRGTRGERGGHLYEGGGGGKTLGGGGGEYTVLFLHDPTLTCSNTYMFLFAENGSNILCEPLQGRHFLYPLQLKILLLYSCLIGVC